MSRPPAEEEGWSSDARALLHAYRSDHDLSVLDRARLDRALAERLNRASGSVPSQPSTRSAGFRVASAASAKRWLIGVCLAMGAGGAFWATHRDGGSPQSPPLAATQIQRPEGSRAASPPIAAPATHAEASVAQTRTSPNVRASALPHVSPTQRRLRATKHVPAEATSPRIDEGSPAAQGESIARGFLPPTAADTELPSQPALVASVEANVTAQESASELTRPNAEKRAELALMARINAAVRGAELPHALALCAEHERRWPHGIFKQERDGVRALVACTLKLGEAQSRARGYLADYPHGALAPSVRAACDAIGAAPQQP